MGEEESLKAIKAALKFLRIRPRSRGEIIDYLKRKSFSKSVIEDTVRNLEEEGLIDDRKFIESWLYHRTEVMPRGSLVIRQELKAKKISPELLESVVEPYLCQKEEEVALKLASQRWERLSVNKEAKLLSYLKNKGFSPSISLRVLEKLKTS